MGQISVLPTGERRWANYTSAGVNMETVSDYLASAEVRGMVVASWHPRFSEGLDVGVRDGRFAPNTILFDAAVELRREAMWQAADEAERAWREAQGRLESALRFNRDCTAILDKVAHCEEVFLILSDLAVRG